MSALTPGAKAALTLCGLLDYPELIAGMAELAHPADAAKYVPMVGPEPEPKAKGPMWVVATKGEITLRAGKYVDPTCFVVDGDASWLGTSGLYAPDGTWQPPLPPAKAPTMRLPPLGP